MIKAMKNKVKNIIENFSSNSTCPFTKQELVNLLLIIEHADNEMKKNQEKGPTTDPHWQGILKKYKDGYVLPRQRFDQIEKKAVPIQSLLRTEMLGYIKWDIYYILCWQNKRYFNVPFAKNELWFKAYISEPGFEAIKELPQIIII